MSQNDKSKKSSSKSFEITDFSLFDSTKPLRRPLKKNLTEMAKYLLIEPEWDERNWDDDDDEEPIQMKKPPQIQRQTPIKRQTTGKDYPMDLWYLIASYINPEDVGRFALLCRSANRVVKSTAFWMRMFQKFDSKQFKRYSRILVKEDVPIVQHFVIRSLYQDYPLFRSRWDKREIIQKDPHFLVSSRCVRIWYSTRTVAPDGFDYYFQFRFDQPATPLIKAKSSLIQNSDQLCLDRQSAIVHVISPNFLMIGQLIGTTLSDVQLPLSCDFRFYKLKFVFDSSKSKSISKSMLNKTVVTIDPVSRLKVYRWFDCPSNLD